MPDTPVVARRFEKAVAQIPSCALTEEGVREQRARYGRLARHTGRVRREPEAVIIEFDEDFDREALDEALAVERQCCPFFQFAFDEARRRLRVTVGDPEQLPALDAMAHAVGARDPGSCCRPRQASPSSPAAAAERFAPVRTPDYGPDVASRRQPNHFEAQLARSRRSRSSARSGSQGPPGSTN
jgi:hypothetical protein